MDVIRPIEVYAARTPDPSLLRESASGGAFTELARVIIASGGVVFGVAWNPDFSGARHIAVEKEKDLSLLRGSKYTTSDMTRVYPGIRAALSANRPVLFSGTPCQCAAVRKVFGNNEKLFFCALICMANAKAEAWRDYAQRLEKKKKSRLVAVNLRGKRTNSRESFACFSFADSRMDFEEPLRENMYWKRFFSFLRAPCYSCQFRGGHHGADLQIGDFWGVGKYHPNIDSSFGVSAVLVYSTVGRDLVHKSRLSLISSDYDSVRDGNPYLEISPTHPNPIPCIWVRMINKCTRLLKMIYNVQGREQ